MFSGDLTRGGAARAGLAVIGLLALACSPDEPPASAAHSTVPEERTVAAEPAYVGTAACAKCHPDAYEAWTGSDHDRAMQVASEDTVLGDFSDDGPGLRHGDEHFRFFRRDGRYYVRARGADGEEGEFEIPYTFGVEPLQQYLVSLPRGRLQALSTAWDSRPAESGGQRWFDLFPDERRPPGDPFHWTGRYQTWNHMCAECHSTALEKHYDAATDSYATTWKELDVGCEACHGPGSDHVAWAGSNTRARDATGLVVDFARAGSEGEVSACAPCHARRHRVSPEDAPGRPLLDDFMPATLRPDLYHADGQILDEVYVYGSFVQSAMYAKGVRCSDCHDSHSLHLRAEGNALCTRCHSEAGNARFPSLKRRAYDTAEHHFHEPGTAGAACVSCHMPARTYMEIDPRRDHGLRVPRPDLSVRIGTPNACADCHADRGPAWAADAVAGWRPADAPVRPPHFAEAFQAARSGDPAAVPALTEIARDTVQPAIVRATALELLSAFGPAVATVAAAVSDDPDPMVRALAVRAFAYLPMERRLSAAAPLLRDPVRAVRVEAARVLAAAPRDPLSAATRTALEAALSEYRETQWTELDTPSGQLNLAVLAAQTGEREVAVEHYVRALEMDPDFFPARANLAVLYGELARSADAERVLREGIARDPDQGELHYSLGLVLAGTGRVAAAAGHIGRAAELMPNRARVHYNHGLALLRSGEPEAAEAALRRAAELDPRDPEIVYALVAYYVQQQRLEDALEPARHLLQLTGGAREAAELVRQIEGGLAAAAAGD